MGKKAKSLLKIGSIYLGTILGAGFASGQELLLFFVRFGRRGLLGCLLAGCLFCLLGALVLEKANAMLEKNCKQYLKSIFGQTMSSFLYGAMEAFLCISFCIMLSGSGAFFNELFSLPWAVGVIVTDAICLLVFLYDLKGLSIINVILTPIMLLGTLFVCFYSLFSETATVFLPTLSHNGRFLPYTLFYVGYNMLTAIAVLVPASHLAENRKVAIGGGVFGGLCLTIMSFLSCLALYFEEEMWGSALPMLMLSKEAGAFAYGTYSAVLYMSMLTTAVATGFSVLQCISNRKRGQKKNAVFICLVALPLAFVEFSALVRYCYVFFGVLGIILVIGILWDWYKKIE